MLCVGRLFTCIGPSYSSSPPHSSPCLSELLRINHPSPSPVRWRLSRAAMDAADSSSFPASPLQAEPDAVDKSSGSFCIIEGPETVQDFAKLELQELQDNIRSRRNKIFLHMEEVRRLRIQQRIKSAELGIFSDKPENELPNFPSFIPFLPPLTPANLRVYYATCFTLIGGIILFGGLLAPTLELKLGLGGTSYEDFIRSMHLPFQLSQVDPIVASFSGGAVGVISALMVVEVNNVKQQEHKRCKYCLGTGYLACARCSNTGTIPVEPIVMAEGSDQPLPLPKTQRCKNCLGAGKVMIAVFLILVTF
ncbi:hypothetical protein EJ110_NYTH25440 [Nymphaea thermarum]|nr:hypothetical protein EJ110_NYTH25440 [Nymphaea thermarum]